jgi:hypothetical protein
MHAHTKQDDPLQEMFAAVCTISPSASASGVAASPISSARAAGRHGSLTGAKAGLPLLVSGVGGTIRSSLLGQSTSSASVPEAKHKAPVAGRLSSQASSSSSAATGGVACFQTGEEDGVPLSPPTGAGPRAVPVSSASGGAVGGRQVVVEEDILTRLMEKIDLLESRLREFEQHGKEEEEEEEEGLKQAGKGKGKKEGKR